MTLVSGFPQGIFESLHQKISRHTLRVGYANVQRHWCNLFMGQGLTHQNLANPGAVTMGNYQLVFKF